MSISRQAKEASSQWNLPGLGEHLKKMKEAISNEESSAEFKKTLAGTAGKLAIPAGLALAYGTGKLISKIGKKKKGFEAMVMHAGADYHDLPDTDKERAKKFYELLHRHSPTAAEDPIAAWNHVSYFMIHQPTYMPGTVEGLRRIEAPKQPAKIPGLK